MAIERDAFERRLLPLLGSLLGVARRLTRNDADAEDLVAETVVRAWRGIDGLDCEAAFRSWLFRILHHTFVSEYRRARARPQLASVDDGGEPDGEGDEGDGLWLFERMHQPFLLWFGNPEQAFLDKLLRDDLERALAALPEAHRIVVLLADLEEFSYGEIAATLGVPVGTVRSRLSRARAALQKMLWQQAQEYGLQGEAVARAAAVQERAQP